MINPIQFGSVYKTTFKKGYGDKEPTLKGKYQATSFKCIVMKKANEVERAEAIPIPSSVVTSFDETGDVNKAKATLDIKSEAYDLFIVSNDSSGRHLDEVTALQDDPAKAYAQVIKPELEKNGEQTIEIMNSQLL